MTKKVLIISYYFPPMGMGGTQRSAKFVKYLPDSGWTPSVLTVKNIRYYAHDPALLADLGDIRIIRTGSLDP
ncbi:glycosyl transferase family 1, partial [bacterium]|nr:glycosyl transferase family 1 [bacterium]